MLQYWLYLSIHTAHSPNHRGLHESLLWVGYRLEVPSRIISWPPKKDQLRLQHRIGFVRFCQTLSLLPLSSLVRKYKDANLRINASSHSCWPHHGHRKHFPRPAAQLKRCSDFILRAPRPFTTSFASRLRRPGRIHEDLLKVFLNPQPVCKNLLQKWLLALSFYLWHV